MNQIDIILIIPLVWAAFRGFMKGFIVELASIIALVGGVYVAFHFSGYAAGYLSELFDLQGKTLKVAAFSITFIAVIAAVFILAKFIEGITKLIMLSLINKIAGSIFGVLKTALILSGIIFILNYVDTSHSIIKEKNRKGSLLFGSVEMLVPALLPKVSLLRDIKPGEDSTNLVDII